jgi:hypothetical protein
MLEDNIFKIENLLMGILLVESNDFNYCLEQIIMKQPYNDAYFVNKYKEWAKELDIDLPLKDFIT